MPQIEILKVLTALLAFATALVVFLGAVVALSA